MYLNYENYCRDFVEGIRSPYVIARKETPNSPYFRKNTSLVLLMCHQSFLSFVFFRVEKPLVFYYLSYSCNIFQISFNKTLLKKIHDPAGLST